MDLAKARSLLAGFDGGTARLMSFTASHDRLVFEVQDSAHTRRNEVVLVGCTRIQLPTWWRVNHISIDTASSGFTLTDEGVEVFFEHEFQVGELPS